MLNIYYAGCPRRAEAKLSTHWVPLGQIAIILLRPPGIFGGAPKSPTENPKGRCKTGQNRIYKFNYSKVYSTYITYSLYSAHEKARHPASFFQNCFLTVWSRPVVLLYKGVLSLTPWHLGVHEGVHEGVHDHVENITKSTYVGLVTKSTVTAYTVSYINELTSWKQVAL
jgi:hypothetical protein